MANEEQLEILRQGVEAWNKWRKENPEIEIELNEADLSGTDLSGANFFSAELFEADLKGADLSEADLGGANLCKADLRKVNLFRARINDVYLIGADLREADLMAADLLMANLSGANLSEAEFDETNLSGTNLSETNLTGCYFNSTILADVDLSVSIGLETIVHYGPSTIGMDTIKKSKGKIPAEFLRGCGLGELDIEYAKLYNPDLTNKEIDEILYKVHDLRAQKPLQISPLFISYSHADSAFVDKIEEYLNAKGIRFWRDVHHATAGRLEKQIDRAIRHNPTVLLVLSENAINSDWVEHEVRTARELEKETERDVLCPVALDDSWKSSSWPKRVMEQVMEYNILDFSKWKDDAEFGKLFKKLIDGLELFYK